MHLYRGKYKSELLILKVIIMYINIIIDERIIKVSCIVNNSFEALLEMI